MTSKTFVTLGMFIIDEFSYTDEEGNTTKSSKQEIGGGGTYATIGARLWLPSSSVGMIVDKGYDFPSDIEAKLKSYGDDLWLFRPQSEAQTTRALNLYKGDHRGFQYLTPRIRITPRDLSNTPLARPKSLHFICSPARAAVILSEVQEIRQVDGWNPVTIYEPIPDRCIPEELPALIQVLPFIGILSPNAEEALSLLSVPNHIEQASNRTAIEQAAQRFIQLGTKNTVIIRSGALGAYVLNRGQHENGSSEKGKWINAYWTSSESDQGKIVDVTGAGNSFLGGLGAGLELCDGDVYEATFYGTVSASFIIEQSGLPALTTNMASSVSRGGTERWNNDSPLDRLEILKRRHRS